MYRVMLRNGIIIPFDSYVQALEYQQKYGGTLYERVYEGA